MSETPTAPAAPAARRTLLTLLAAGLGAVPLKALLKDNTWLVEAWLTMFVVIAPAALLRLRRAPSALDIWPGIALLVPWLTVLFVPHHAWGGLIPNSQTWSDVSHLMDDLHETTRDSVAPITSTVAVRLVVCALLGLLAALLDLIAVVARRGALAGVPLLVVYTIAGAVPRSPVAWGWFAIAAVGFLILLSLDAEDEVRMWGRRISRSGSGRSAGSVISAPRIGVLAVAVAIAVPLLVPSHPRNLIADAFHGSGGSGGNGFGAGSGTRLSPFAALKGQLQRDKPVPLMTVHVDGAAGVQPFYVRSNVLSAVTEEGWQLDSHGRTEPVATTSYPTLPPDDAVATVDYRATITIKGLADNPPVFAVPRSTSGLPGNTPWSVQDQLFAGGTVHSGQQIIEEVTQPAPTADQLAGAGNEPTADLSRWLGLPSEPAQVRDIVAGIIAGKTTPYAKARAISDWFADPANGFVYSLKTQAGDSGSDLLDFLTNRVGYCQQYAAAMGIMLRLAGVPSRVVLGYMHPAPDANGNFTITTNDAHAWVEAYFPGLGWIPFDPTPTDGLSGGRKTDLAWAPHVYPSSGAGGTDSAAPHSSSAGSSTSAPSANTSSSSAPVAAASGGADGTALWVLLLLAVLLIVGLIPAAVRAGRRRRRLLAARHGDTEALWAELSDTAVDLGYVWSPARTPRQVSAWLGRDLPAAGTALDTLAAAVEHGRYAPAGTAPAVAAPDELARDLRRVAGELRSRRSGRMRLLARVWPASLGWGHGRRTH